MMAAMNTSSRHIASVTLAIIGFGRRCPRNRSGIATDCVSRTTATTPSHILTANPVMASAACHTHEATK